MFHYILNGKWFESCHADFNFQIVYKWWSHQIYKIDFKLKSSKFNVIFPVDYNLFNFNIPKKKDTFVYYPTYYVICFKFYIDYL